MPKTTVKKHPRKTTSGRTSVKRHSRLTKEKTRSRPVIKLPRVQNQYDDYRKEFENLEQDSVTEIDGLVKNPNTIYSSSWEGVEKTIKTTNYDLVQYFHFRDDGIYFESRIKEKSQYEYVYPDRDYTSYSHIDFNTYKTNTIKISDESITGTSVRGETKKTPKKAIGENLKNHPEIKEFAQSNEVYMVQDSEKWKGGRRSGHWGMANFDYQYKNKKLVKPQREYF